MKQEGQHAVKLFRLFSALKFFLHRTVKIPKLMVYYKCVPNFSGDWPEGSGPSQCLVWASGPLDGHRGMVYTETWSTVDLRHNYRNPTYSSAASHQLSTELTLWTVQAKMTAQFK